MCAGACNHLTVRLIAQLPDWETHCTYLRPCHIPAVCVLEKLSLLKTVVTASIAAPGWYTSPPAHPCLQAYIRRKEQTYKVRHPPSTPTAANRVSHILAQALHDTVTMPKQPREAP